MSSHPAPYASLAAVQVAGPRERPRVVALLTATVLAVLGLLAGAAPTASASGTTAGTVIAWGDSTAGNLDVPPSLNVTGATALAVGSFHDLALTPAGQVVGWGDNQYGKANPPVSLIGRTVTAIAAGNQHSLALTSDRSSGGATTARARRRPPPR